VSTQIMASRMPVAVGDLEIADGRAVEEQRALVVPHQNWAGVCR
jgi:hypothetical protein